MLWHQFAYRANRSTEDTIDTLSSHCTDPPRTPGELDFSSAFNTIVPSRLVTKLMDQGSSQPICLWIRTTPPRPSAWALALSTGSPQGCVLSARLYTLYNHVCAPSQRWGGHWEDREVSR